MDPEQKDPSKDGEGQPEGTQPTATATSATTTKDSKYVGLQQALEAERAARRKAEAEAATLRGDPTADEKLASANEELERLRTEIAVRDLKAENPEIADIIDVALAEGTKLTPGVIAAMKAKVAKPSQSTPAAAPASSGIRNSAPSTSRPGTVIEDDAARHEYLSKATLF